MEDIPGIEMKPALDRLMNNRNLYRTLLQRFPQSTGECSPSKVQRALKNGDQGTAERMAHTLKNLCANIGAEELAKQLETLERMIRRRKEWEEISLLLDKIDKDYNVLVAHLNGAFSQGEEKKMSRKPDEKGEELSLLTGFLEDYDPEAELFVEKNSPLLRSILSEEFPRFQDSVRSYDFDTALDIWRKTRKTSQV
ncbi:MAG: Hpt domain-containing protein [Spirochaetales bacterium]|nr:Hpt domain-containing protein [Spirochaetales bacterium]